LSLSNTGTEPVVLGVDDNNVEVAIQLGQTVDPWVARFQPQFTNVRRVIARAMGVTLDEATGLPQGTDAENQAFEQRFAEFVYLHEVGHEVWATFIAQLDDDGHEEIADDFREHIGAERFATMFAKVGLRMANFLTQNERIARLSIMSCCRMPSEATRAAPLSQVDTEQWRETYRQSDEAYFRPEIEKLLARLFDYTPELNYNSKTEERSLIAALAEAGFDYGREGAQTGIMDLTFRGEYSGDRFTRTGDQLRAALARAIDEGKLEAMAAPAPTEHVMLMYEGDPRLAELIAAQLAEDESLNVRLVDKAQALAQLASSPPGLVITCTMRSSKAGPDAIEVQEEAFTQDIPIVEVAGPSVTSYGSAAKLEAPLSTRVARRVSDIVTEAIDTESGTAALARLHSMIDQAPALEGSIEYEEWNFTDMARLYVAIEQQFGCELDWSLLFRNRQRFAGIPLQTIARHIVTTAFHSDPETAEAQLQAVIDDLPELVVLHRQNTRHYRIQQLPRSVTGTIERELAHTYISCINWSRGALAWLQHQLVQRYGLAAANCLTDEIVDYTIHASFSAESIALHIVAQEFDGNEQNALARAEDLVHFLNTSCKNPPTDAAEWDSQLDQLEQTLSKTSELGGALDFDEWSIPEMCRFYAALEERFGCQLAWYEMLRDRQEHWGIPLFRIAFQIASRNFAGDASAVGNTVELARTELPQLYQLVKGVEPSLARADQGEAVLGQGDLSADELRDDDWQYGSPDQEMELGGLPTKEPVEPLTAEMRLREVRSALDGTPMFDVDKWWDMGSFDAARRGRLDAALQQECNVPAGSLEGMLRRGWASDADVIRAIAEYAVQHRDMHRRQIRELVSNLAARVPALLVRYYPDRAEAVRVASNELPRHDHYTNIGTELHLSTLEAAYEHRAEAIVQEEQEIITLKKYLDGFGAERKHEIIQRGGDSVDLVFAFREQAVGRFLSDLEDGKAKKMLILTDEDWRALQTEDGERARAVQGKAKSDPEHFKVLILQNCRTPLDLVCHILPAINLGRAALAGDDEAIREYHLLLCHKKLPLGSTRRFRRGVILERLPSIAEEHRLGTAERIEQLQNLYYRAFETQA
jgi:hypothetical protein